MISSSQETVGVKLLLEPSLWHVAADIAPASMSRLALAGTMHKPFWSSY